MVSFPGGIRKKARHMFKKNYRQRGKLGLRAFFKRYKDGESVVLKAEPGYQGGIYASRFHGRSGTIAGKQGRCYYVKIKDGKSDKKLLVHPIHLKSQ